MDNKKIPTIVGAIIILIIIFTAWLFVSKSEQGKEIEEAKVEDMAMNKKTAENINDTKDKSEIFKNITVFVKDPNAEKAMETSFEEPLTSPFLIKGEADYNWFPEGWFDVVLVDADGTEIASAGANAAVYPLAPNDEGVWPFAAELSFKTRRSTGKLIFKEPDFSKLNLGDYEIPVKLEINLIKEVSIADENEISWTSGNDAKVYLKKVKLDESGPQKKLVLYFDVKTQEGGYCWQAMDNYLRITDENDDFISPEKIHEKCISGYSTMKDQFASFSIPSFQESFDVYNRGRDYKGDTKMVKMFSVNTTGENLEVKGYPQK